MNIGMIGAGKLGLPVSVAIDLKGHDVMVTDVNPALLQKHDYPHLETGPDGVLPFEPFLRQSHLRFGTLAEVVKHSEIIFVAVQTPHDPRFEGVTPLPDERVDFDYTYLKQAMTDITAAIDAVGEPRIVSIISTVLPGTIRREIVPLLSANVKLAYQPFFIAMGTTMRDFLYPEFVLLGVWDKGAAETLKAFWSSVTKSEVYETTVENAEAIKVFYNTYISTKIAFVNTVMEMAHKLPGCDVDQITDGLKLATRRLISPSYMTGGAGDGGGCHPRDNIALSWLARQLNLSFDWFEAIMTAREEQTDWIADLAVEQATTSLLPLVVLGKAFKEGTNITTGSPAKLLIEKLEEYGWSADAYDPYIDTTPPPLDQPAVFVVMTKHPEFACYDYPAGSVIIDVWRYVKDKPNCKVIKVGVGV